MQLVSGICKRVDVTFFVVWAPLSSSLLTSLFCGRHRTEKEQISLLPPPLPPLLLPPWLSTTNDNNIGNFWQRCREARLRLIVQPAPSGSTFLMSLEQHLQAPPAATSWKMLLAYILGIPGVLPTPHELSREVQIHYEKRGMEYRMRTRRLCCEVRWGERGCWVFVGTCCCLKHIGRYHHHAEILPKKDDRWADGFHGKSGTQQGTTTGILRNPNLAIKTPKNFTNEQTSRQQISFSGTL